MQYPPCLLHGGGGWGVNLVCGGVSVAIQKIQTCDDRECQLRQVRLVKRKKSQYWIDFIVGISGELILKNKNGQFDFVTWKKMVRLIMLHEK